VSKTYEHKGWERYEALKLLSDIEPIAAEFGLHVGMCGSVLHKGGSNDDLDLVVFPLKTEKGYDFQGFQSRLEDLGLFDWFNCSPYHEEDKKTVFSCFLNYKQRIDWFLCYIDENDVRYDKSSPRN